MNIKQAIPNAPSVVREALIVIGGAVIAAFVIGKMPTLKRWIKEQWGDTPQGL